MTKIVLFQTIICLLLISCQGNTHSSSKISHEIKSDGNADSFLKLFPEISGDTIQVHYVDMVKKIDTKYLGKKIDPKFYHYLFGYDSFYRQGTAIGEHLFSCYKIKLPKSKTGLLIRVPSQYSESAVTLFIWDNSKGKIVDEVGLSDAFGDEGWGFVRDAWITDINKDGLPDIVTRQKDEEIDMEDTTGNIPDKIKDSFAVLLSNGWKFKLAKYPIDTSKFQLKDWPL